MPKLFADRYGRKSRLLERSDVIHTSFWGGDLEASVLQPARATCS
jgi:hypothetical protein